MEISVIIPCYNAAATLAKQLEALAEQDFSLPWEVIVADNGSTDESVEIARSFDGKVPFLRIIAAGERRGAAHARNRGAEEARAPLLAFCDADDEVAPSYVSEMVVALRDHPFVACRYEFSKLNRHWITRCHTSPQAEEIDGGLLGPYRYAGGGSLGVRKEVHEAVEGFDESLPALEDTDYCIRLQRTGYPLHFAADALVHVRWKTTIWGCFTQARNWGRSFIQVQQRYWPTPPETVRARLRQLGNLRRVRNREQLAKWIWTAGWQVGAVEGWWEYRKKQGGRVGEPPSLRQEPDTALGEGVSIARRRTSHHG